MKKINFILTVVVLACLLSAGCVSSRPTSWNLSITKSTYASIEVDLVGITTAEKPYWQGYDIDKYWNAGDLRRKNAKPLTQILKMGQPWVISIDNSKWQEWLNRGATELLVIANLPGHFDAGLGDPRRIFLSLNPRDWKAKNQTLEIEIQDTMILVNTAAKAR